MDKEVIIRAEGLGKKYVLGQAREAYTSLRDVVANRARTLFRRNGRGGKATGAGAESDEFWALRDVNFEVRRGEVVGIIGRNGAGKSTLLKVLSRITEPTTGRISLRGRVASLLEVGTGFHPELTGRENIFLNGAILGMHRREIKAKFDEIVSFAEVERFLDTPVKRYSSGMYVRLAFAVAAHLEPEILIVDEVLAVGDAAFQKKCLGKMQDVSRGGRTVLFVSHSMTAINNLCSRGIYLKQGRKIDDGPVEKVTDGYIKEDAAAQILERSLLDVARPNAASSSIWIESVRLVPTDEYVRFEEPIVVFLSAKASTDLEKVFFGVGIDSYAGARLVTVEGNQQSISKLPKGMTVTVKVTIPRPALPPGRYSLSVGANAGSALALDSVQDALVFEVRAKVDEMLIAERVGMGTRPRANWEIVN